MILKDINMFKNLTPIMLLLLAVVGIFIVIVGFSSLGLIGSGGIAKQPDQINPVAIAGGGSYTLDQSTTVHSPTSSPAVAIAITSLGAIGVFFQAIGGWGTIGVLVALFLIYLGAMRVKK